MSTALGLFWGVVMGNRLPIHTPTFQFARSSDSSCLTKPWKGSLQHHLAMLAITHHPVIFQPSTILKPSSPQPLAMPNPPPGALPTGA